jgi:hypothetical protein
MLLHSSFVVLSVLAQHSDRPAVIVVVGAAGTAEYGRQFEQWAARIAGAAEKGGANVVRLGPGAEPTAAGDDRERLQQTLKSLSGQSPHPVWLVLVGHGSYDRRKATFNLEGRDISADDLAEWLKPLARPVAVVNCASCSGPFINRLAAPDRAVVTATRSGSEQNFARFGEYFSQAVVDLAADLDKDQQVSLLEAYLAASKGVEEFYKRESRLATEHALLDDTGDGLGTPADWFRGVRATRAAKEGGEIDGLRASQLHLAPSTGEESLSPEQREKRDSLEASLEALRRRKEQMEEAKYYAELEPLLLQLAQIYAQAETAEPHKQE